MDKSAGVRVPAPIFNRRRPRQALFAHPNNSLDGTDTTPGSQKWLGNTAATIQSAGRGEFNASYQGSQRVTPSSTTENNTRAFNADNQHYPPSRPPSNVSGSMRAGQPRVSTSNLQQPSTAYTTSFSSAVQQSGPTNHSQRLSVPRGAGQQTNLYRGPTPAVNSVTTNRFPLPAPTENRFNSSISQQQRQSSFSGRDNSNIRPTNNNYLQNPPLQQFGGNQLNARVNNTRGQVYAGQSNTEPVYMDSSRHDQVGRPNFGQQGPKWNNARPSAERPNYQRNEPRFGADQPKYGSCPSQQGNVQIDSVRSDAQSQYGQQPWGTPALPAGAPTERTNPWIQTQTPMNETSSSVTPLSNSTATKTKTNASLRVLTATIQGMKHWSRYSHKLPMIFEVFGTLNSAISANNDRIEYNVKDDKDQLRCVFYQIDRKLPRLVRSQWLRCVGTYSDNSQTLQCVSVRQAVESEVKLHKNMVNMCDKSMRECVSKLADA